MTATTGKATKMTGRIMSRVMNVGAFLRFAGDAGLCSETLISYTGRVALHKLPEPVTLAHWCRPAAYVTVGDTSGGDILLTYFTRKPTAAELS